MAYFVCLLLQFLNPNNNCFNEVCLIYVVKNPRPGEAKQTKCGFNIDLSDRNFAIQEDNK